MAVVFAAWVVFAVILGILIARKRAAARHRASNPDIEQIVVVPNNSRSTRRTGGHLKHTLNSDELDLIPVVQYGDLVHGIQTIDINEKIVPTDSPVCAICLDSFVEQSLVRSLACAHVFHSECIDKWLLKRSCRCPLCNADTRGIMNIPQQPSAAKLAD
ncbi:hypothetical protein IW148_001135 [Coemansia sp. RSA 1199]|nr:hypothetical protein IW148_001135 [Coemansia sp. RSA 1199]